MLLLSSCREQRKQRSRGGAGVGRADIRRVRMNHADDQSCAIPVGAAPRDGPATLAERKGLVAQLFEQHYAKAEDSLHND